MYDGTDASKLIRKGIGKWPISSYNKNNKAQQCAGFLYHIEKYAPSGPREYNTSGAPFTCMV